MMRAKNLMIPYRFQLQALQDRWESPHFGRSFLKHSRHFQPAARWRSRNDLQYSVRKDKPGLSSVNRSSHVSSMGGPRGKYHSDGAKGPKSRSLPPPSLLRLRLHTKMERSFGSSVKNMTGVAVPCMTVFIHFRLSMSSTVSTSVKRNASSPKLFNHDRLRYECTKLMLKQDNSGYYPYWIANQSIWDTICPHVTETIFGNKITCSFCVFALFTQDDAQLSCLGNSSPHILCSLSGDGYVKNRPQIFPGWWYTYPSEKYES